MASSRSFPHRAASRQQERPSLSRGFLTVPIVGRARRRLDSQGLPKGLLVPHRSRFQEPRRLHQLVARLLSPGPRHGVAGSVGGGRGELVLLLAALAGITQPPASASANTVLAHITRTVTGESALLHLDPSNPGVDVRATQSLRELMRDTTTGRSVTPTPELVRLLAALAQAFPGKTISIVHGYADPERTSNSTSHAEGRALDLRIDNVDCTDIERFLVEHPRLLARVGCFPNATFLRVDVGRSRGIWFDASVGTD